MTHARLVFWIVVGWTATVIPQVAQAQAPLLQTSGDWSVGAELTFMMPRFNGNPAWTSTSGAGRFTTIENFDFSNDLVVAPRVWLNYQSTDEIGIRMAYWEYDQASQVAAQAAEQGEFLVTPAVQDLFILSALPGEKLSTQAGLDAHTIDMEVTKATFFGAWGVVACGGLRYASIRQDYSAARLDAADEVLNRINSTCRIQGFGPTLAVETHRPLAWGLAAFVDARVSLLYGEKTIAAQQIDFETDPADPFVTAFTSSSDGLLPIGELRVGGAWFSPETRHGQFVFESAFEAQIWGDAGNSTGEPGDMGFVGFTLGLAWLR